MGVVESRFLFITLRFQLHLPLTVRLLQSGWVSHVSITKWKYKIAYCTDFGE